MPSQSQFLPNGETSQQQHFHSTLSLQKLRRFNTLILIFRFASFCFSLTSTIFMATNTSTNRPDWKDFDAFRFVLAANAIVCLYSFVEMGFSIWEILKGVTILPEIVQVWFDFGHDQVFAYMLLAANAAGTGLAKTLSSEGKACSVSNAFCVQSNVSVALGFAGFLFLGFSSLLSGFRVVCFIINGSRFHL
ncbi:hypothetical protein GIB67_040462 [Kingdonia uniflora]|uniref:CASP-like protein n=1 Tax=Kingdonia uniflora TaxID=39325 RepID=A0A7J7L5B4_9MAGN|nr:hypothetical protein GIB67_040462 [Kingdonia uniflora]